MIIRLKQDTNLISLIKSILALGSSSLFVTIVSLICALIQGIFVNPETLGYYKQFTIIPGYLFIFHFGIFQAIERFVPYHLGQDEHDIARKYVSTGYAWVIYIAIFISIIFLFLSIRSLWNYDFKASATWLVQLIISLYTFLYGFLSVTYRSSKNFIQLSKCNVKGSLAMLTSLPLFFINPYAGLLLKNSASSIGVIPLYRNRPFKDKPKFNILIFVDLVKLGLPLFVASYITGMGMNTVRNTMLIKMVSTQALGYWAFAFMVFCILIQVPQSVIAVFGPKIIQQFGEESNINNLISECKRPVCYSILFTIITAILAGLSVTILIPIILPNYISSIKIIVLLLPNYILKPLDMYYIILLATKDVKWINIISLVASTSQIVLIIVLFYMTKNIYSFPIALVLGQLVKVILTFIRLYILKDRKVNAK